MVAFRLGITSAEANVGLQRANRFSDAYLLYQPYTYQNNAPFGKQSGTSWALGITVPLPVYNRNQGNIERAKINVHQSQVSWLTKSGESRSRCSRRSRSIEVSGQIAAAHSRSGLAGPRESVPRLGCRLFQEGEVTKFVFLDAQRKYNDMAKAYLDAAVRHRRSMLTLNTVVGQRICRDLRRAAVVGDKNEGGRSGQPLGPSRRPRIPGFVTTAAALATDCRHQRLIATNARDEYEMIRRSDS